MAVLRENSATDGLKHHHCRNGRRAEASDGLQCVHAIARLGNNIDASANENGAGQDPHVLIVVSDQGRNGELTSNLRATSPIMADSPKGDTDRDRIR